MRLDYVHKLYKNVLDCILKTTMRAYVITYKES